MGQRLLLVDSDRSFVKEHQVSLEAAFDLELAASPEGVVPRLESGAFAAAFICVEVADNKGYALCSAIRKNPKLEGLKVILISAKATEEEYRRHQNLNQGKSRADLYLHKPMAPSSLVAALTPLVPGRALDPDNPLGELVDFELGDDWLDGLRGSLEGPAAAPAAVVPEASVTLNLDEFERGQVEVEALRASLAADGADLRSAGTERGREDAEIETLKAQLDEALAERAELIRQVETLRHQTEEQAQGAAQLVLEQDDLRGEALEQGQARVAALEASLAAREGELAVTRQELETVRSSLIQINTTLEGLVEQQVTLEGVHQAALLELAGHKERAHTCQLELAELEVALQSQGRDLADLAEALRQREAELATSRAQIQERDTEQAAQQDLIQRLREEEARLGAELAAFHREVEAAHDRHDGEKLELMSAIDQKEEESLRLNQALAAQEATFGSLERDRQALQDEASGLRERLQNLEPLLLEIQEQARRASDLARG